MRRAASAIRSGAGRVLSAIGLEGALLIAGTYSLAVFASYFSAAGPWLVVGAASSLAGVLLAGPLRGKD